MKISDFSCAICHVGPVQGRNLYRDEATREWRCLAHLECGIDSVMADLVRLVGPEPPQTKQRMDLRDLGISCLFAGPGRGDCEHFIGLPGISIPGQHDGKDDTVDVYGKPNGWCWPCWKDHRIVELQKKLASKT